jgi:hypothetical protein
MYNPNYPELAVLKPGLISAGAAAFVASSCLMISSMVWLLIVW